MKRDPHGFRIAHKRCDECLFTDAKIVPDERRKNILKECLRKDKHFICHKATLRGSEVMCRGHYDAVEAETMPPPQMLRIAERLGAVVFCDPATGEAKP